MLIKGYSMLPAVSPLTSHFSIEMNKITTGMMAMSDTANT